MSSRTNRHVTTPSIAAPSSDLIADTRLLEQPSNAARRGPTTGAGTAPLHQALTRVCAARDYACLRLTAGFVPAIVRTIHTPADTADKLTPLKAFTPPADTTSSGAQVSDPKPESGERRTHAWQCPTCGRHVPRHVEACRCGSERRRLEALGYKFDSEPSVQAAPAARVQHVRAEDYGFAGTLFGYQLDTDLGAPLRVALKVLFGTAVIALVVTLVRYTHTELLPTRDNIQILSTLDAFTRNAGPEAGNTIPTFITSTGRLGVLTSAGTPEDLVKSLQESESCCLLQVLRSA